MVDSSNKYLTDDEEYDDDDDDAGSYFDTISINSSNHNRHLLKKTRQMALSRNTIYQSAVELQNDDVNNQTEDISSIRCNANMIELNEIYDDNDGGDRISDNKNNVKTYSQWRDKRWRHFTSNADLTVDFVLAYDENGASSSSSDSSTAKVQNRHNEKRKTFEMNLESCGLILEREENQRIHFVKLHVPKAVLCQYAELLKLRFPIKSDNEELPNDNIFIAFINRLLSKCKVTVDPIKFPPKKYQLTTEFNRDKKYLFDVDAPNFFNSSIKITVASYILEREKFSHGDQDRGIKRLIADGVYKAAYPLHDGDLNEVGSKRHLLLHEWASVNKCIKYQPIDEIKDYFGVKLALYFVWLGFYTHMLIPAAIIGILCLIYAVTTLPNDTFSRDLCTFDIIMCPLCDKYCDYWKLQESCTYSKIQHFIDNPATLLFAVFMSLWSALYLEFWKRYSAEVTHRWGLTGFDLQAEPPRPEYLSRLANAKRKKLNVVTQLQEPVVPFWRVKLPSIILSFTIAVFWALIALAVVIGIVIYRMSLLTSDALYKDQTSIRIYVVPCTAGLINLLCIVVLNMAYDRLALWLTETELQRTQTEFDDSLALKIYIFQFVNYYSSIFYIAFFKGKFVGYPAKYNKIFGYRQEECNPGGCLMELTMQLAIIMIGKQAMNTIIEMVIPLAYKMYKTFVITTGIEKMEKKNDLIISCNQWTEDYKLSDLESQSLFSEYLEMVLQYGFVTLFVTAFPLAPLFALINNVLEMRLDAKKFIKYYRRPIPQRVKNIGVWYPILSTVGRIAVASNAMIIAFSSHFIPKLVYMLKVNPEQNTEGFLEFTLAYFNTSDFKPGTAPENSIYNVTMCRYSEYRNPPNDQFKYKRPLIYWHILAARLAFIVVYQNLVSFIMTIVEWTIPDISRKLNDRIKREAYKINEIIIKHEKERATIRKRNSNHFGARKRDSMLSSVSVYHDAFNETDVDV